jgi:hypothetical protein
MPITTDVIRRLTSILRNEGLGAYRAALEALRNEHRGIATTSSSSDLTAGMTSEDTKADLQPQQR